MLSTTLSRAATAIRDSTTLLITAGAGMGVDSGLPDFRGPEGFWQAYPPYRKLGLSFQQLANPDHFSRDPHLAWGFYGHRMHLYRDIQPHSGFETLRRWASSKPAGYFVFTSNVDGQFAKAGFPQDRIVECHGSIHHLQCTRPCSEDVWPAEHTEVRIDQTTMRALDPLPTCPRCGEIARPNILMFGDGTWLPDRTDRQENAYRHWKNALVDQRVCIIECGAGTAIPTVRMESQLIAERPGATLIRINVREADAPQGHLSIALPAAEAIQAIAACTAM